jgi:DNA-directed RNA polymerase specialized sigma24 family protein
MNNSPTMLAGLLTPQEVAKILQIPVGTLGQWLSMATKKSAPMAMEGPHWWP